MPDKRHQRRVTKPIHDPTTRTGKHASADQPPLVSRQSVAEVPLTGLSRTWRENYTATRAQDVKREYSEMVTTNVHGREEVRE
jgi:hypothetical protein